MRNPETTGHEPHVLDRVNAICPDAVKVLNRLNRYGFKSFLCGGSVRDLLLDLRPKDFDIATDATPRQVKRLFRNSRIIGRRFRLVQVTFADKILEVSTFRSAAEPPADGTDLLIQQDNTFGTPEEDARRRDFTINGLFYDTQTACVIDYVGGMADLDRRVIETIGDPWIRFREDPVRMLRAVKFAGRLGFRLADDVYEAIVDCRREVERAAQPRVLEEILRLMNLGGGHDAVRLLFRTGLLEVMLPELHAALDDLASRPDAAAFQGYWRMLRAFDDAVRDGEAVTNARIFAVLFSPLYEEEIESGGNAPPSLSTVDGLTDIAQRLRMARRDAYRVRQVMLSQRRLFKRQPETPRRKQMLSQLSHRDYFQDSWFFFRLRAAAFGGELAEEAARVSERLTPSGRVRPTGD